MSPSVTGIEHRKIEPITKRVFPLQDKSIYLAKPNGYIKEKYKAIKIMHKTIQRRLD